MGIIDQATSRFHVGKFRAEGIVGIEITIGYEIEISFVDFKGTTEKKFSWFALFVVNNESVAFPGVANIEFGL
jgi:hypothetical protein